MRYDAQGSGRLPGFLVLACPEPDHDRPDHHHGLAVMTNPIALEWRDIGPTTVDVYGTEFARVDSPLLPYADLLHAAAASDSALCLAHMWLENQYSTTGILIRPEHHNPLALRPGPGTIVPHDVLPGYFLAFQNPVDCVREWQRRIHSDTYKARDYPGGAYASTTSLTDYVHRYHPPGDDHPVTGNANDSDRYMVSLTSMLSRYAAEERIVMALSKVPFPPFDDRPISPYAKINCGASYGICDPKGITYDHSMVGYLSSTDAWFRKRDVCALTPWGIGCAADGALDGKIWRWMDYTKFTDVQPWSSGPWMHPGMGDGLAFVQKYGVAGINGFGEAIELSDGGRITTPVSVKQWKSLIWLKAAIAHRENVTSDMVREILAFMHHREICIGTGKDCPFPRVYLYTEQYLAAVVTLMAYFERKHNDLSRLVFKIAGLTVDLRDVGAKRDAVPTAPAPKPAPTGPIFQDFTPNRTFTINVSVANVRRYAGTSSDPVGTMPFGRQFVGDGYYYGESIEGENRWIVQNNDPRGRIWAGLVKEAI